MLENYDSPCSTKSLLNSISTYSPDFSSPSDFPKKIVKKTTGFDQFSDKKHLNSMTPNLSSWSSNFYSKTPSSISFHKNLQKRINSSFKQNFCLVDTSQNLLNDIEMSRNDMNQDFEEKKN